MSFDKIEQPRRRSSYVAEQIIDSIDSGKYEPGDQLPSERKIAEQMGVSRNSVREALSALQIVEVVETKAGSGTYIKSMPNEVDISDALNVAKTGEDLFEVWEARREVEIALAKLAWRRAEEDSISEIRDILSKLEEATETDDYDRYVEANANFHMKIAELAENSYLKKALDALLGVTEEHLLRDMVTDYSSYMKKSLKSHQEIVEVIHGGPPTEVDSVVTSHFQQLENYLKERLFRD